MPHLDLLPILAKTMKRAQAEQLAMQVAQGEHGVKELLGLTFHYRADVAFRASWTLEIVAERYYARFAPSKEGFIMSFPGQRKQSCRRHFLKILLEIQKRGGLGPGASLEPLIEAAFEWLIDENASVAVKVHCFAVLLAFSEHAPWIAEELCAQTEFLMKTGSAGVVSRGRKVLKALKYQ